MTKLLTILFMPESAYGPTNNCVGIGHELARLGHRVVFAAEASWKGKLEALGFEEDLVDLAPPAEDAAEQEAGSFWKDYIAAIAPEFAKPTVDQLTTVIAPIWEELIAGAKHCEPQLRAIIERTKPDVIVEDNVLTFPALVTAGVPFVRIVSCNPLEIVGENIPPAFSGLSENDHEGWASYRAVYDRVHRGLWSDFDEWVQSQDAPPLPDLEFIHSGDLNLYVYPEALDYTDARPLDASWRRLDSSVRHTDTTSELPTSFTTGTRPLIYFSLGSLGSADVSLMRRVLAVLATVEANIIVSLGPFAEEIPLAENMWGSQFLPQTTILPQVDLVITHGGNNTVTESLHFGKPMIVLPLFWDQYDNAQRVQEKGFGTRLSAYSFDPDDLRTAIEQALGDPEYRERVARVGAEIRSRDGVAAAAAAIAELGVRG